MNHPAEVAPDPHISSTSSAAAAVHLHQFYRGIPVFQMVRTIDFSPGKAIRGVAGDTVTIGKPVDTDPHLQVTDAFAFAIKHAALQDDEVENHEHFSQVDRITEKEIQSLEAKTIAYFGNMPSQPTVLAVNRLDRPVKAGLLLFPKGERASLAWEFIITMPEFQGQYQIILDSGDGKILYCRQLLQSAATAYVYTKNPNSARKK